MKRYAIKNYRGNIVESLTMFQKKFPGVKICEVKEKDDGSLNIVVEESNSVEFNIKDGILLNCKAGKYQYTINVPHGVKKIAKFAISGLSCDNVVDINVPEGVTDIERGGISGNYRLENIELPKSLKTLEKDSLANNEHLNRITFHGKSKEEAFKFMKDAGLRSGDPMQGYIKVKLDDKTVYAYTGSALRELKWDPEFQIYRFVK